MKKVLFSFAIATMMASLISCGNKTGQNTDGQDSLATEVEADDANREQLTTLSVVVPEGWTNQSIDDSEFFIRLEPEPSYTYDSERSFLSMDFFAEYSAETYLESVSGWDIKEIEKKTIDGVEFTAYNFTNEKDTLVRILGDKFGDLYLFETNEKSYGNADVQAMLKSIKLKKYEE